MNGRLISIVVPVYNEEESLAELVAEIRAVCARNSYRCEVVFIDDGSRDASWAKIRELAASDPALGGIRFRRNAGKAAALTAGFQTVRGDVVIMMDADLQDPPEEIPNLLARLDEGYDLVSGWKRRRHDPWHKVYPSRVFNRLIGSLTGVRLHDHVCGLKCMRREVAAEVRPHGDFHRFISVLAAARGFRVTEIATLHRSRTHGYSKYGFTRFAKGFLDLLTLVFLTRFRFRPQHLIGATGLILAKAAILVWLGSLLWAPLHWVLVPLIVLLCGAAILAVGLVAEMVVDRASPEVQGIVSDRVGWCSGAVGVADPR